MTEETKRKQEAFKLAAKEANRLAEAGLYRCKFCKQEQPISEGIVVTWGNTQLFACCPSCFRGHPIVIKESTNSEGKPCVYVGPLREEDKRSSDILLVSDVSSVGAFAAQAAHSTFKKKEMFEDE
jgi:hypothetical protein